MKQVTLELSLTGNSEFVTNRVVGSTLIRIDYNEYNTETVKNGVQNLETNS